MTFNELLRIAIDIFREGSRELIITLLVALLFPLLVAGASFGHMGPNNLPLFSIALFAAVGVGGALLGRQYGWSAIFVAAYAGALAVALIGFPGFRFPGTILGILYIQAAITAIGFVASGATFGAYGTLAFLPGAETEGAEKREAIQKFRDTMKSFFIISFWFSTVLVGASLSAQILPPELVLGGIITVVVIVPGAFALAGQEPAFKITFGLAIAGLLAIIVSGGIYGLHLTQIITVPSNENPVWYFITEAARLDQHYQAWILLTSLGAITVGIVATRFPDQTIPAFAILGGVVTLVLVNWVVISAPGWNIKIHTWPPATQTLFWILLGTLAFYVVGQIVSLATRSVRIGASTFRFALFAGITAFVAYAIVVHVSPHFFPKEGEVKEIRGIGRNEQIYWLIIGITEVVILIKSLFKPVVRPSIGNQPAYLKSKWEFPWGKMLILFLAALLFWWLWWGDGNTLYKIYEEYLRPKWGYPKGG